ncbi:MAG: hypothetical protein HWD58_05695 [Bacteroidota bacterium]|nr:MAG: hypothetical protein HWD58_05695 [Bacteroidota bacterium]
MVGHGPLISETRTLSGVQNIDLSMDARVEVTQDSVYFLEVVAQANIQDEVLTQQDGTTLKIKSRSNVWIESDDITIEYTFQKSIAWRFPVPVSYKAWVEYKHKRWI